MADVKKIKLPDNSVYNIKDYRIPGVDTVPTSGSGNVITSGGIYAANYAGSNSNGGPALKTYGIPYGAVDSASTATVITATVDNFPTELRDGVCAYIRNDIVSSASGWTLNVNGTGAKPVYITTADATRATTQFSAATTYLFIYNSTRVSGGCWDLYYGYDSNSDTNAYNVRSNAATAPTKSKFYSYRILFTSPDGQYLIPSNTSTSTNATATRTVNQDKIDPFGPIWYYSTTTAVEANASASASYLWMQYSGIYLGYSFNRTGTALTLTAKDPVYIKCAPQTDGSAIIDANTPFVQSLPSTEDGKIYIFLGYADSATTITLYYWHPVYYYKDSSIRLWTNAADTKITVDTELDLESENPISNGAVTQVIYDNEQVTAAALNNLDGRVINLESSLEGFSIEEIEETNEVTSAALNDLNDRMLDAEDTLYDAKKILPNLGEVTSAALNDLNYRTVMLEDSVESLEGDLSDNLSSIRSDISTVSSKTILRLFRGDCSTAANTRNKVVGFADGNTFLATPTKGDLLFVTFSETNTATQPRLSVNSNVRDIKTVVNGQLVNLPNIGVLGANQTVLFQYDGTYWVLMTSGTNSNPGTLNTTSTSSLSTNSSESLNGSVSLHKVAKTGSYDDLVSKPTIPTTTSSVISGSSAALTSGGAYTALSGKEDTSNKVTSISSSSTDTQYPSAKAVYTQIGNVEAVLDQIIQPAPILSVTDSVSISATVGYPDSEDIRIAGDYLTGNVSLSLSGTNAAMFSLSTASVTKSQALAGYYVTLTYTPTASGTHSATITVSSSGATSKTIAITGTANTAV